MRKKKVTHHACDVADCYSRVGLKFFPSLCLRAWFMQLLHAFECPGSRG
jgi:hypothetical protein